MPRVPKQSVSTKQAKETYFLVDKHATQLGQLKLTSEHHKKGVQLSPTEASYFVASGTLSTVDPSSSEDAAANLKRASQVTAGVVPAPVVKESSDPVQDVKDSSEAETGAKTTQGRK